MPCEICNKVPRAPQLLWCYECRELATILIEALAKARQDGATSHDEWAPESYKEQSRSEHLEHALIHVICAKRGDVDEDHIAHAVCRLAMANANT